MDKKIYVKILSSAAVFIIYIVVFAVGFSSPIPTVSLEWKNGEVSLSDVDFENTIAEIPEDCDWYAGALYDPSDFERDDLPSPGNYRMTPDAASVPYGTYRIKLTGARDEYYLLTGYSVDYSMKIWFGNNIVYEAGQVSDDPEKAVPRVNYFNIPVTQDGKGTIFLIIQYSNFVHDEGGGLNSLYIGSGKNISFYNRRLDLVTLVLSGGFIILALSFLLQVFTEGRGDHSVMALCCLLAALRNQRFYLTYMVSPDYNWYVHYRIIVMNSIWMSFCFLLLIHLVSNTAKKRSIIITGTAVTLISSLLICLLPARNAVVISFAAVSLMIMLFICKAVMMAAESIRQKKLVMYDILIFIGMVIILAAGLVDYRFIRTVPLFTRSGIVSAALLSFLFIIRTLSDFNVRDTQIALVREQEKVRYLERQNKIKNELLSSVSHEIRTPLSVISGYSQMVMRKLNKTPEPDPKIFDELMFISSEAVRLSGLADQLTQTNIWKSVANSLEPVDLKECVNEIQKIGDSILPKNGNILEIHVAPDTPYILGTHDLISQIFYNLISNAGRHTKNDVLTLDMYPENSGEYAAAVFTDHGNGMTAEQIEHAFETGYSKDGGHGIGLSICKEIVSVMGGEIKIESELGKLTSVIIRFPAWKEKEEE